MPRPQFNLGNFGRIARASLGAAQTAGMAQLVAQYATKNGVDPTLAIAVAQQESGLNPTLINTKSGATGLMQLMPATAASLGVTNALDPAQNADGGTRYLAQLLQQFGGDQVAALAAYNWGPTAVSGAMARYGSNWLAYAPSETQNYVAAILGVTPASYSASQQQSQPVTLDASTGEVVADTSGDQLDVASLAPVGSSGVSATDLLIAGVVVLAGYWIADNYL